MTAAEPSSRGREQDARRESGKETHAITATGPPPTVWGGLALALLGCVVLGAGITVLSWTVSLVGAVLIALGAGIGVRGGALRDARPAFVVDEEIREVSAAKFIPGCPPER